MEETIGSVHRILQNSDLSVATAESCTSGLLAAALTETPGSSAYYLGGVNSYANSAKVKLLGVPNALIDEYGAVSAEVCRAMVEGIRERLDADIGLALTGIAGPDGGTEQKPVGTVWLGLADCHASQVKLLQLTGSRAEIRKAAVIAALSALAAKVETLP